MLGQPVGLDAQERPLRPGRAPRSYVHDAERPERKPGTAARRHAGVEPDAVRPQEWIAGKPRVGQHVLDDHRIVW
jgi:hypothetical protein